MSQHNCHTGNCQGGVLVCSRKVRMSSLGKVGMSSFIEGRRDDARGANRIEPERAGAVEGIARSEARAFAAAGSGRAVAAEPAPGAASAAEGVTRVEFCADAPTSFAVL